LRSFADCCQSIPEIPSQNGDEAKKQIDYLEQKLKDTEAQLNSAHDMIDELEFELESVSVCSKVK
jgi:multidrug resistance efflux pump